MEDENDPGQAAVDHSTWAIDHAWWVLGVGGLLAILAITSGLTWLPKLGIYKGRPDLDPVDHAIKIATAIGAATAGLLAVGRLQLSRADHQLARDQHHHTEQAARNQERLTEQGQHIDRYTRSIEQLAGTDDVALGGIYALERLGDDSGQDQQTITEVLSAYVRQHTRDRHGETQEGEQFVRPLSEPVQAALTVLGRTAWHPADLHSANLTKANLRGADLTEANLRGADLTKAGLTKTNLTKADLIRADFTKANLRGAIVTGADLRGAILTGAYLEDVIGLTDDLEA